MNTRSSDGTVMARGRSTETDLAPTEDETDVLVSSWMRLGRQSCTYTGSEECTAHWVAVVAHRPKELDSS